jgi:CoA:oxalate CoA-transferase
VKDPNLDYRDFFKEVAHPVIGKAQYPGTPWKLPGDTEKAMPAPLVGQHNQEVYGELGVSKENLCILNEAGII